MTVTAALVTLLGWALHPALAAAAAATNSAAATVLEPGSIVLVENLRFGAMSAGVTPGTATISATTGAITATGGVTLLTSLPTGRAHFLLLGKNMTVKNPDGSTTITLVRSGGTETMVVNTFSRDPSIPALKGPSADLYIGATLQVGANQAPGVYSGTFTVTMSWN